LSCFIHYIHSIPNQVITFNEESCVPPGEHIRTFFLTRELHAPSPPMKISTTWWRDMAALQFNHNPIITAAVGLQVPRSTCLLGLDCPRFLTTPAAKPVSNPAPCLCQFNVTTPSCRIIISHHPWLPNQAQGTRVSPNCTSTMEILRPSRLHHTAADTQRARALSSAASPHPIHLGTPSPTSATH
jgi:hypothetical protein